ncbi:hypothetical protein ES815_21495 [Leclercia adecarboxylata]|uniref:Uncharacterized protein n=1 Tax=Leclercia adecarboxylata TaxID=83655 RepID=A0AAP9DDC2_9ENTR|nr:hypothetical protein [Leclercia adecarboxylata]QDK20747.1 hypothetical protein ES815_21495 [Leclercia adecarboxylata]
MTYLRYSYQENFNFLFRTLAYSAAGHGVAGPAALLRVSLRDRLIISVWATPYGYIYPQKIVFIFGFHEQFSFRTTL